MKRALGVVAALALLGGVAFALIPDGTKDPDPVTVSGLIGSEKRDFFDDPAVKAELKKNGLVVRADSTGSWTMSEQAKSTPSLDFAFPASAAPAREIQRNWQLKDSPLVPFYSPLVIVTHEPAARVLAQGKLAQEDPTSHMWTFRMDAYAAALKEGRKWTDLPGAAERPELAGPLFVSTTDPETSSSGALYLALLSYVAGNDQVVQDDAGVNAVRPLLGTANRLQGMQKISSDEPFRDFFAGVGTMVFAYESQAAALPLRHKDTGDMVVMYPDTTIQSDHTLVARTDNGRKLADLLENDPVLRALEAGYGLRPQADQDAFWRLMQDKTPKFARDLRTAGFKQATLPSLDNLNKLIDAAKGGTPK
ncbi:hypothetical protein ACIRD3_35265 [Kitasatospora sp. NPDC093550]|uniref:hypothetical protein n=1 Tax=Kitasatospora sp. NPDC093550 TaxID=3364089 RepID=UPI00380B8EEC